ncbi:hypothetical protein BY996DRAFT_6498544 [Phakopsora pachyrhizi]|nr:hypothetical protein BY996DRAFT_6498544 [Phakopsora pachyrhizi]
MLVGVKLVSIVDVLIPEEGKKNSAEFVEKNTAECLAQHGEKQLHNKDVTELLSNPEKEKKRKHSFLS